MRKTESVQTLSPNIERIKVNKVMVQDKSDNAPVKDPSFEESEINNRQSIGGEA